MTDPVLGADRIETAADLGNDDAALWAFWFSQDRIAGKEEDRWTKRARKVVQRYRDERPGTETMHRFNVLWANVQTLKPVLYARTPKPDVQRRFLDQDDTGRLAAILLERSLAYALENCDFDASMQSVVEDRLLPGRGVHRVMYVPHYGDEIVDYEGEEAEAADIDGAADAGAAEEPLREVVYEEVITKYIYWEDYREGAARTWEEVPWVRYRAFMTRDELTARFGNKKGKRVNLDITPKGANEGARQDREELPPDLYKKAEVWEIWDKANLRVIWLAPNTPDLILDEIDDPLHLPGFFPNPDPLLATTTTGKRIPVPDFVEYQDQAHELDRLTGRIDRLTRALKVSGVYPGSLKQELQQLIDEGTENKLIPVADWAAWSDKGGLSGFIQYVPIKEIAETLIQLYAAREKTKDLLYELTGIGDIMRGETVPTETASAQQLKANFATRRIQPQQRAVARFARDTLRLMAAVIAEHFSPQTISMITGYPQLKPVPPQPPQVVPQVQPPAQPGMPPQQVMAPNPAFQQWQALVQANQQEQQKFDAAVALIKKDGVHGFRLDIEADSTVAADEMAEQAARTEFLGKLVPLMQQVVPISQGNQAMAKLAKEITLFAVRGFKVARTMEEAIEEAFDALAGMPPNPQVTGHGKQGPTQNPQIEAAKVQADMHDTDTKAQTERMGIMQKQQQADQEMQLERDRMAAEAQHNATQVVLEQAKLASAHRLGEARMMNQEMHATNGMV